MTCNNCEAEMEQVEKKGFGCHNYYQYECECGNIQQKKELRDDVTEIQREIFGKGGDDSE